MNCWPVSSLSCWQTTRDSTSVAPPAGKRLMYLTGLLGQSSMARATPEATNGLANAPPTTINARRRGTTTLTTERLPGYAVFSWRKSRKAFDGCTDSLHLGARSLDHGREPLLVGD